MVHKPPEPEGTALGQGLFIEHKFLSTVVSLLLLVNTHGSFLCKQGVLLVNMSRSLHCKQGSL